MKKYFALMVLLFVSLAACMYEYAGNDDPAQPDTFPVMLERAENPSGLQAALTFSNEFGVGFLLRNETGS